VNPPLAAAAVIVALAVGCITAEAVALTRGDKAKTVCDHGASSIRGHKVGSQIVTTQPKTSGCIPRR
jgi:hypothetical protein